VDALESPQAAPEVYAEKKSTLSCVSPASPLGELQLDDDAIENSGLAQAMRLKLCRDLMVPRGEREALLCRRVCRCGRSEGALQQATVCGDDRKVSRSEIMAIPATCERPVQRLLEPIVARG
jgi:hypothetical protein